MVGGAVLLASPMAYPPLPWSANLLHWYGDVQKELRRSCRTPVVALGGGVRDVQVQPHLTSIPSGT